MASLSLLSYMLKAVPGVTLGAPRCQVDGSKKSMKVVKIRFVFYIRILINYRSCHPQGRGAIFTFFLLVGATASSFTISPSPLPRGRGVFISLFSPFSLFLSPSPFFFSFPFPFSFFFLFFSFFFFSPSLSPFPILAPPTPPPKYPQNTRLLLVCFSV